MSITNNTKMTNAQFQKHLQQYDINKDGKIDESDAKALDALAKKQAAQSQDNSFEPGTQNALQRQSNSNKKKANALRQMLKKDNNGTIDKNDTTASVKETQQHQDLKKLAEQVEMLETLSKMMSKFDNAHGGDRDGNIWLRDLKKVVNDTSGKFSPAEKALARKLLNNTELVDKLTDESNALKKGNYDYGQFSTRGVTSLLEKTKAALVAKEAEIKDKKASSANNNANTTNSNTNDANKTKDQSDKYKPQLEKYKGTDATQTVQTDITNVGREIKSKWDEYRDPNTSKEQKEKLRTEIQELTQEKSQLMQFLTNMLRMQHENAMAVIRNIR